MSINLVIQSENNKTVDIYSLSDYSLVNSTVNNNLNNLPYDNYVISIMNSHTQFNFNNFFNTINEFVNNGSSVFMIILGILLLVFTLKYVKNL